MKSIVFILILLAGLAFGGKFYVEQQYKKEFDKIINQARPFVELSYRNISVWFDGSISISELSARNPNGPGSATIKKITGITSDRLMPIRGKSILKSSQIPDWFKLDMEQFAIDTVLIEPPVEDECTSFQTAFIYSEIGIDKLFSNMSISFDFTNQNNSKAIVRYQDQVSESDFTFNFSVNEAQSAVLQNKLPVKSIQMNSSFDPEFASQFNQYCAKKLDMTVNQYLSEVVASPRFSFDSFGYNLGDQVSKALVSLMQGGRNVNVSSTPTTQIKSLQTVNALSRKNIVKGLQLKIKLDETPVLVQTETDNNFEPRRKPQDGNDLSNEAEEKVAEVVRPRRRTYVADSVSNIPNLINQRVKIWRTGEKARIDGRIDQYTGNIAFIEIRKFGGKAIYEIDINDIEKIQVLK